ncbi:DUF2239 family protein [Paraburkholderia fungorum]|jgi:hypothetical protein|uniref:DUF2239 family protein n=1 Tax=Paraburkholderia fungorum TaxID=134537 RepID=A0AAP5Q8J5_9BURK|nr:DUF2239 family protein [Paraburkholderia fungorum]MDT8837815.1 DUF2239 family protein [Paraburkholderia fungorum]PRZ55611.1 hypothetical protein BX589_103196 [Paraburkholderia fungorum]
MTPHPATCIAFEGHRRIASGTLAEVALAVREVLARGERAPVLIFDTVTSRPVEFDLRGTPDEILARLVSQAPVGQPAPIADAGEDDTPRGRGRPKLGVVAREVTLLPRHWDWLNGQSGGASVALRKLVEAARLAGEDKDRKRAAQESVYRFMTALAGNLPAYEDATRALYADDQVRFDDIVAAWPEDVRDHTLCLAADAFVRHP